MNREDNFSFPIFTDLQLKRTGLNTKDFIIVCGVTEMFEILGILLC